MDEPVAIGDVDLCRWFATIFARELPGQAVEAYRAGAAAPFLDAVAARGDVASERAAFEAAIAAWSGLTDPTRQMETEFASLFLLPGKDAPQPYASYYEEQTLYGAAHDRMRARLAAEGLTVATAENGPADHLSVMLEYLAHLLETDGSGDRIRAFVEEELLPLVEAMSGRLERQRRSGPFYPAAAGVLAGYLKALVRQVSPA